MNASETYKTRQKNIALLIAKIKAGLDAHGEEQSQHPRDWGYTGDLAAIEATLQDLSDRLHGEGEYAE